MVRWFTDENWHMRDLAIDGSVLSCHRDLRVRLHGHRIRESYGVTRPRGTLTVTGSTRSDRHREPLLGRTSNMC